ncbi:MAG: class I SAM-dependent methyltransferase [Rhodocyclaceae bacterium]|nr:class I SAM-dependent methyltransferase [Rhodocyclaceae bacterium]
MAACPLCGNPSPVARDAHAAHCPQCDLLINLDTAALDYAEGGGQAVPDPAKMRWRLENARRRFALLEPWLGGIEVFVDIGCGSGEMLEAGAGRFAHCVGFDTNRPLIAHIRAAGRAIAIEGHFDAATLPPAAAGRRTLFAASHVIEHLEQPLTLVRQVVAAMKPGDIFYVEVPLFTGASFRKLGYRWSLWNREHLMLFSPMSLAYVAANSGLALLAQGTRIFARGSHSMKTRLRLLRESPGAFLRTILTKPRYLSVADAMVADYGFILLRMPNDGQAQTATK